MDPVHAEHGLEGPSPRITVDLLLGLAPHQGLLVGALCLTQSLEGRTLLEQGSLRLRERDLDPLALLGVRRPRGPHLLERNLVRGDCHLDLGPARTEPFALARPCPALLNQLVLPPEEVPARCSQRFERV